MYVTDHSSNEFGFAESIFRLYIIRIANFVSEPKVTPLDINDKIIYGLERISDAFKTLLWEKAKDFGISPIQIQLLIFIANHKSELCKVTHLAKEFNVTKPTVSDAVRVLINKKYLDKDQSDVDSRSYSLLVTEEGKDLISRISSYTEPLYKALNASDNRQLEGLYSSITTLINSLNANGVIQVQRSCFSCRFYQKVSQKHHCNLLNQTLAETDIRLDCAEHQLRE